MTVDVCRILKTRMGIGSWILIVLLLAYFAFTFVIFFQAVIPSYENDTTSDAFAVDSTTYVYMADSLREGRNEPWVLGALTSFPNTVATPVAIAFFLQSAVLVMLLNYAILAISVFLLKRSFSISTLEFLALLLLNPTTTTSILCVNKEILDLLVFSLFMFARVKRYRMLLLAALVLALINRYETCVIIVCYLIAESRLNPWRERRFLTLLLLVGALNFVMPLVGSETLTKRFEEAESAGVIRALDMLQLHYLYFVAVIPKIADNLFGQLPNPQVWKTPSSWLYLNFFNNIAAAILILINIVKRRFTLRSDFIYLGAFGSILLAQALVVQPRYFYFVYVLLCLEAARKKDCSPSMIFSRIRQPELQHA
jgi:hypothetical protein